MDLHGLFRELQGICDLAVRAALGQKQQHLGLTAAELAQRGVGAEQLLLVDGRRGLGRSAHQRGGQVGIARQHLGQGVEQLPAGHRLGDVPGDPQLQGPEHVLPPLRGRHDDQRDLGRTLADHGDPGEAVHARHGEVEQDQVEFSELVLKGHHVVEAAGFGDRQILETGAHELGQALAEQCVVVGNQYLHDLSWAPW